MSNQDNNNENMFDINDIERLLSAQLRNSFRNSFRNISNNERYNNGHNLFGSFDTDFFNYNINNYENDNTTNESDNLQTNESDNTTNENDIFNSGDVFQSISNFNVEDILNFSMIYNMVDSYYEQLDEEILNETLIESLELQPDTVRQNECLEFEKEDYSKIEIDKFENSCSICLNDYEKDSVVSTTKCNHLFHHECIKEWSHYKDSCPVCREKLKE